MDPEEILGLMINTHSQILCMGRPCVIHHRTMHHMRGWWLSWREDRKIFERQCPHGIGHPDPDQYPYWKETDRMAEAVHGCDGCCHRNLVMGELADTPREIGVDLPSNRQIEG